MRGKRHSLADWRSVRIWETRWGSSQGGRYLQASCRFPTRNTRTTMRWAWMSQMMRQSPTRYFQ